MAENEYIEIMSRLEKMEQIILGMNEKLNKGNLPTRDILGHKEAAAWLGISQSSLYRLVSKGQITVYKSGDSEKCGNYYIIEDLERWVKKRKKSSEDAISSMAATYCATKPRKRYKKKIES